MNAFETNLEPSRRGFLQLGSVALISAGIGCNSQPSQEAPKTPPSEGAGTTPAAATQSKEIAGTAPNTILSKEYVQMIGRFAYFWGWPMVNSFNRRAALTSVTESTSRRYYA